MIDLKAISAEAETASTLAAVSRHISVTALEAAIRLVQDSRDPIAAHRMAAIAKRLTSATEELGVSVEAENVVATLAPPPTNSIF